MTSQSGCQANCGTATDTNPSASNFNGQITSLQNWGFTIVSVEAMNQFHFVNLLKLVEADHEILTTLPVVRLGQRIGLE